MIEWRTDWQNVPRDGRDVLMWLVQPEGAVGCADIFHWEDHPHYAWLSYQGQDDELIVARGGEGYSLAFWAEITPPDARRS